MSTGVAIAILLISFFVMIFLRFPIAYAVALSSLLCLLAQGQPLSTICQQMVKGISSFSLMAVLSAALAIRRGAHIRMTAFDTYLPKNVVRFLDILSDLAVLILAIVMIVVGWSYATKIGAKGTYVSMPGLSKFWQYFPIPLAGVAMLIFELEALYNHIKAICLKEDPKEVQA